MSFEEIVAAFQVKSKYALSTEQANVCRLVYDQCRLGNGQQRNVILDSTAGSGKTSTLLQCLWFVPPDTKVLLLSFNKSVQMTLQSAITRTTIHIMDALDREMPRCTVNTSHAHGLSALKRAFGSGVYSIDPSGGADSGDGGRDNKQHTVQLALNEIGEGDPDVHTSLKAWKWHMGNMLRLLMNLAVDCSLEAAWTDEFVSEAGTKYGVPVPVYSARATTQKGLAENKSYAHYMRVIRRAYDMCVERVNGGFDFTDMVYLPIRLGLPLLQYDLVMIDESQDLNAVQIEMISRSIAPLTAQGRKGWTIFVGDKSQSLYGFRGADTHAMDTIAARFDPIVLPLHVCWRCPLRVIEAAQRIVPRILARPGAPEGLAVVRDAAHIVDTLLSRNLALKGHLVLCRTNAPLIELAIKLMKKGIGCYLTAGTVKEALQALLRQIDGAHWIKGCNTLLDKAIKFRDWRRGNMKEAGEEFIEKNDQLESLCAIIKSFGVTGNNGRRVSVQTIEQHIDELFTTPSTADMGAAKVRLSTVHQCKGQEEDAVYVIRTDLMPHPSCVGEWQLEQEENLKYVAITRAKCELYWFIDTK